jgi:hypothetical protein
MVGLFLFGHEFEHLFDEDLVLEFCHQRKHLTKLFIEQVICNPIVGAIDVRHQLVEYLDALDHVPIEAHTATNIHHHNDIIDAWLVETQLLINEGRVDVLLAHDLA